MGTDTRKSPVSAFVSGLVTLTALNAIRLLDGPYDLEPNIAFSSRKCHPMREKSPHPGSPIHSDSCRILIPRYRPRHQLAELVVVEVTPALFQTSSRRT